MPRPAASLAEFADQLERQLEEQDEWQSNLLVIAASGREAVARELAKMGPDHAGLVAHFAAASQAELNRASSLPARGSALPRAAGGKEHG